MVTRSNIWCCAVAALSLAVLSPAEAQADERDPYEQARTLFVEGVELAKVERWAEALAAFQRSSDLVARPSTSYNIANALYRLDKPVEALAELVRLDEACGQDPDLEVCLLFGGLGLGVTPPEQMLELVTSLLGEFSERVDSPACGGECEALPFCIGIEMEAQPIAGVVWSVGRCKLETRGSRLEASNPEVPPAHPVLLQPQPHESSSRPE